MIDRLHVAVPVHDEGSALAVHVLCPEKLDISLAFAPVQVERTHPRVCGPARVHSIVR